MTKKEIIYDQNRLYNSQKIHKYFKFHRVNEHLKCQPTKSNNLEIARRK